jgi:hypothetical protein
MKIDIADIPKGTGPGARGRWHAVWDGLLALPPGKAVKWRSAESYKGDREFHSLIACLQARIRTAFKRGSVKLCLSSRADGVYIWLDPAQGAKNTPAQAA